MQPNSTACTLLRFGSPAFKRALLATVSGFGLLASPAAFHAGELPSGGSVVSGGAAIGALPGATPGLLINQSTDRAIVNWSSFSIGGGHQVHFDNASGATLNRVTGASGSQIDGLLSGTGSVFLVNPHGVIIGRDGVVDVGGSFVGSTLDVSNSAFMSGGDLTFSGDSTAAVVNYGRIGALGGDVALIGARVENHGAIDAPGGTAALVAGHEVLMRDAALADGKFLVKVGGADTAAVNTGAIRAAEIELRANQGNVLALAGNTDGVIRATGVQNSGGRVFLTAPGGSVQVQGRVRAERRPAAEAPARQGGEVFLNADAVSLEGLIDVSGLDGIGGTAIIEGRDITLAANARIDASGSAGGLVLIGGDYQGGADPANNFWTAPVLNAETVTVADGAVIAADASAGDGGNVVLWSDAATDFAGLITARGGPETGDGGFVEVSSKGLLGYSGIADLSAPAGTAGTLLLDPRNVTIGGFGDWVVTIAALEAALASGNVLVTTDTPGNEDGDITVAQSFAWHNNSALTLNAHRHIRVNHGVTITNTGAGDLNLRADSTGRGVGRVEFIGSGRVNFSQSTGAVSIFYNPPSGYTSPVTYHPFVSTNPAVANQLTAYMLVNNVFNLQNIQQNLFGAYALGRNIDARVTASWNAGAGFKPIGTDLTWFRGTLEGNMHTIDGLTINHLSQPGAIDYVGLFMGVSSAGGSISNVGLTNVNITVAIADETYVGALAGANAGSIVNSYVTGQVRTIGTGVRFMLGGLVGHNLIASIADSYSQATVTATHSLPADAFGRIGNLVGYNAGSIVNSHATGSTSASILASPSGASIEIGGLAGGNQATIDRSYATGSVQTSGVQSSSFDTGRGGLVGSQYHSGIIRQSYATGAVTSLGSGDVSYVGGLVGASGGHIAESYATGPLASGAGHVGGLLGENWEGLYFDGTSDGVPFVGSVATSYWDTQRTGQLSSDGGVGLTTAQLKAWLPAGFNPFVWGINPNVNNGYPHLRWQVQVPPPSPVTILNPTRVAVPNLHQTTTDYFGSWQVDTARSASWSTGSDFIQFDLDMGIAGSTLSVLPPSIDHSLIASEFASNVMDAMPGLYTSAQEAAIKQVISNVLTDILSIWGGFAADEALRNLERLLVNDLSPAIAGEFAIDVAGSFVAGIVADRISDWAVERIRRYTTNTWTIEFVRAAVKFTILDAYVAAKTANPYAVAVTNVIIIANAAMGLGSDTLSAIAALRSFEEQVNMAVNYALEGEKGEDRARRLRTAIDAIDSLNSLRDAHPVIYTLSNVF